MKFTSLFFSGDYAYLAEEVYSAYIRGFHEIYITSLSDDEKFWTQMGVMQNRSVINDNDAVSVIYKSLQEALMSTDTSPEKETVPEKLEYDRYGVLITPPQQNGPNGFNQVIHAKATMTMPELYKQITGENLPDEIAQLYEL